MCHTCIFNHLHPWSGHLYPLCLTSAFEPEPNHKGFDFVYFEYHIKAFWQSNYKESIIIERVPRSHRAFQSHQSTCIVWQLCSHILFDLCNFSFLSVTGTQRAPDNYRHVTQSGYINCLLSPLISGSLVFWETQLTAFLYCNLLTGLNTHLLLHQSPLCLFSLTKFKNKCLHKYTSLSEILLLWDAAYFLCHLYFKLYNTIMLQKMYHYV